MSCSLWSVRSVRLRVACAIALALTIEGLMRSNLNMAVVCMLNSTSLTDGRTLLNVSKDDEACPLLVIGNREPVNHRGQLYWTSQERAIIFASFYVGGLVATLVTEKLNRVMGATKMVMHGAIANVIGTFLTPFVAETFGPYALVAVRFIMGFGQSLLWPCMSILIAQWFPPNEKSTALAISTTGNQLSVVIAMFVTAELCQLPWGWPMAFHVYAVCGILLCLLWYTLVTDTPADCPHISQEELQYITNCTRPRTQKANWSALLTSPVVWAIAASSFAHNYITVGTVTYLPLYYKTVLNMSLTSNGILSALPFIGQFFSKVVYAGLADEAKKRKWISFDSVTKISNSSASFGMAICFALLCFCDCSQRFLAIVLFCVAMAFVSGYIPGYNTSVVTIAPSQTAAIASFSRIWAQIGSSLAPYLIGATAKQGTTDEWQIVFITIVVICVVTGVFFQCCGSAKMQDWENVKTLETAHEELIDSSKLEEAQKTVG